MRLMKLPETFLENMKELLGGEYSAWLASYEENPHQGLRINTGKLTAETWKSISPYGTEQVSVDGQWILYWGSGQTSQGSLLLCRALLSAGAQCDGSCCPSSR